MAYSIIINLYRNIRIIYCRSKCFGKIYGPYKDYIKICSYDDPRFNIEGMYAPMTHEKLTKEDGKIVYLLLSQWIPLYNPIVMKIEFEEK